MGVIEVLLAVESGESVARGGFSVAALVGVAGDSWDCGWACRGAGALGG